MFHLVVTDAFGHYTRGQCIVDADEIAIVLAENAHCVVKISAQPVEQPKPRKAK